MGLLCYFLVAQHSMGMNEIIVRSQPMYTNECVLCVQYSQSLVDQLTFDNEKQNDCVNNLTEETNGLSFYSFRSWSVTWISVASLFKLELDPPIITSLVMYVYMCVCVLVLGQFWFWEFLFRYHVWHRYTRYRFLILLASDIKPTFDIGLQSFDIFCPI